MEEAISEAQKNIYNCYLEALAAKSNRGYRRRSNFDNLSETTQMTLQKLEHFFSLYPNISVQDFFKAGFKYSATDWLSIDFFKTRKAVAFYNKYTREKQVASPDTDESINSFIEGVKNIVSFMKKNTLNFRQYRDAKNPFGVPWYIIHLKEQLISLYHLHALGVNLDEIPSDYKNLVMKDFDDYFERSRDAYLTSQKMIKIGNKVTNQIYN